MNEKIYASQDWVLENVKGGGGSDVTAPQEWTDEQRAQARKNIGVVGYDWHAFPERSFFAANIPTINSIKNWNNNYEALRILLENIYLVTYNPTHTVLVNNYNLIRENIQMLAESGDISVPCEFVYTDDVNNIDEYKACWCNYVSKNNSVIIAGANGLGQIIYKDGVIISNTIFPDTTLTKAARPADAKAVGDALALKQDKDLVVTITSSTVEGETVFTADKTFAEIKTAISEGKNPVMLFSGMKYDLSYDSSTMIGFTFVRNMNNVMGDMTMVNYFNINNNDVITRQNNQVQCSSEKVSTLSSDADHSHYPSAKAVVDYAATKADLQSLSSLVASKADQTSLNEVSALIGGTSVSEQIGDALSEYATQDWVLENAGGEVEWSNIQNKPFHTAGTAAGEILSETSLTEGESDEGIYSFPGNTAIPLEKGKTYTVMWNGAPYECTSIFMDEEGLVAYILGDYGLMTGGTSTGEPFVIVAPTAETATKIGYWARVYPLDGSTDATFSITFEGDLVDKLNNESLDLEWLPIILNEKEVFPKRTFDGAEANTIGYFKELTSSMFTEGQSVIVEFDEVRYECTVNFIEDLGKYIGDINAFQGSNSDSSFLIWLNDKGSYITCTEGEHTLAIYVPNEGYRYNKIPNEFYDFNAKFLQGISSNVQEQLDSKPGVKVAGGEVFNYNPESLNYATGGSSHAEGSSTTASGIDAHSEGMLTTASGWASHAEGWKSTASGQYTHAEGMQTSAVGDYSHTEGFACIANGKGSHAEGSYSRAEADYSHVQGKSNIIDENKIYAHIVGNGTSLVARSNAHTLDWDGNAWFAGDVYVGSTSGTNKDEGSKKLATEEYVNNVLQSTETWTFTLKDGSTVTKKVVLG